MVPTDEERRYQISSARFCSQTFVEEKDLPKGQKLLTCGRCRETCYVSREAQLENWPHHKHSCRRLSEDHPVVRDSLGFESSVHCLNEIQNCLQNPFGKIRGRLLLYGLQQLLTSANCGSLTMTRVGAEIASAVDYHQFAESIFEKVSALLGSALDMDFGPAKEIAHRLWSIPGFTNFFLSEDRFLSAAMKQWKLDGIPPPSTNKQEEEEEEEEEEDGPIQLPSISTTFVTELLGQSELALAGCAEDSRNLFSSTSVSTTAFGAAVERRFLECWQCPYSRASVPFDAFEGESRDRFFLCAFCGMFRLGIRQNLPNPNMEGIPSRELENAKAALTSREFKKENEVMCGITMKDAFRVILEDGHVLDRTVFMALFALGDTFREGKRDEAPWKFFTFQVRIDLLELFQEYLSSEKITGPNGPIVSVLAYWCTAVLGFSASTVFGVYDTLTGPSCRGKVGPKTTLLIQTKRQELLNGPRKDVQVYLDVIEPAYLRRQFLLKIPALPFPDELADHIAAYMANEQVDGPHVSFIERLFNDGHV